MRLTMYRLIAHFLSYLWTPAKYLYDSAVTLVDYFCCVIGYTQNYICDTTLSSRALLRNNRNTIDQLKTDLLQERTAKNKLTKRLASEMNAKISANESSLENINIKARPMKIAEDYQMLMSNCWLDAKIALDDLDRDDETKNELNIRFLYQVLMDSEGEASEAYKIFKKKLMQLITDPAHADASVTVNPSVELSVPQNVESTVGDQLRQLADEASIKSIMKMVKDRASRRLGEQENKDVIMALEEIDEYITSCARLAWKMALQRPPMRFKAKYLEKPFTKSLENELDLMFNSEPSDSAVVKYYKCPILMHGEKMMTKGSVFVHA